MRGTWWFWGGLAASTAIIGGTVAGYVQFAANRSLVIGLGAAALFLLVLEALYREYGSTPEAEQRARLLQVLTAGIESGQALHEEFGREYGGWWTWTADHIGEIDPGYAAEFRMVDSGRRDSLRKLQDIMRTVRTPDSHLARQPR